MLVMFGEKSFPAGFLPLYPPCTSLTLPTLQDGHLSLPTSPIQTIFMFSTCQLPLGAGSKLLRHSPCKICQPRPQQIQPQRVRAVSELVAWWGLPLQYRYFGSSLV